MLEDRIIVRHHQAGAYEMQAGGRHARADGHLGDEQQRHCDQEPGERGKIQQQRLPSGRSHGQSFPAGQDQQRNPGDNQKSNDPPGQRRILAANEADPLHEPIGRPAPFNVQFTLVGDDVAQITSSK